jgi:hypothetical protein
VNSRGARWFTAARFRAMIVHFHSMQSEMHACAASRGRFPPIPL